MAYIMQIQHYNTQSIFCE